MGVKIKMVTGDALAIARETAKTLGMGANILDGGGLGDSRVEESPAVAKSIEDADGFAQVFPEHKFHIVDVLQKHGHVVGMTGDGVNDAPALKKADCGFAVSGATDAARAAASIVLVTPGLSVIIDAIKESRRIFQRMNSYAIYRIAETLRVLFFMTLAILAFNFYPLTAVMIVMLALLNDGAILSIAYDNVLYRDSPESWDMRTVLSISTVLGVIGVVAAFGLFYLGERVFHLDRAHIQTLMYLKLSVAGHLTIFLTRTRGPFWSIRPARILWVAVLGTQAAATLIAVYGAFMTPLGWGWALFVWGYALAWFLVNDRVKLLAYRLLGATKTAAPRRQDEPAAAPAKAEAAKPAPANAEQAAAVPADGQGAKPVPAKAKDARAPARAEGAEAATAKLDDARASPPPEPHPTPAIAKSASQEPPVRADSLLDMKLGDLLAAGLAKDPEDAGRLIAAGLAQAKSRAAPAEAESDRPGPSAEPAPSRAPAAPAAPPQKAAE
jgi:H+-transporting ATPase